MKSQPWEPTSFRRKLHHFSNRQKSCDMRNKHVGIIGNGSSAIQIVPAIQPLQGLKLWCFARSPNWIIPSFGDAAMEIMGMDPKQTRCEDAITLPPRTR